MSSTPNPGTAPGEEDSGAGAEGGPGDPVPDPQGRILGMPYDLRKPTAARLKSRWWNPADERIFTPKTFGAGWDINLYWLAHPAKYLRHRDR